MYLVTTGKRRRGSESDDETHLTTETSRLSRATSTRTTYPTPGIPPLSPRPEYTDLPEELRRLVSIHVALEQVMRDSLATGQITPDPDTGRVLSVINHISFQEHAKGVQMSVKDFQKLCWLWEWIPNRTAPYSATSPPRKKRQKRSSVSSTLPSKVSPERIRGGSGFCVNITTHETRSDNASPAKCVPAYGIGIEVEWSQEDVTGGRVGGMSAVVRWTSAANGRLNKLREKILTRMKLTSRQNETEYVPLADLPPLASSEPSSRHIIPEPSFSKALPIPPTPASWRERPIQSPSKHANRSITDKDMLVFPYGSRTGDLGGIVAAPRNGQRRELYDSPFGGVATKLNAAYTPTDDEYTIPISGHHGGDWAAFSTTMGTPSRVALYERPRAKEEESKKNSTKGVTNIASMRSAENQPRKDHRVVEYQASGRRILYRLLGIADAVWMLFSTTEDNQNSPSMQRRRALGVIHQVKGSLSDLEALTALKKICRLCPSFLRFRDIDGTWWLEMPVPCTTILEVHERIQIGLQDDPFI